MPGLNGKGGSPSALLLAPPTICKANLRHCEANFPVPFLRTSPNRLRLVPLEWFFSRFNHKRHSEQISVRVGGQLFVAVRDKNALKR